MSTILSFDWRTEGDYKNISWALYSSEDELLEEGDYKVWRFKDLVGKADVVEIEDGFDVEYVKSQLQKIINKYQPKLQPSSDKCWKEFCEYSTLKVDLPLQEGIAERLDKQDKFKPVAKQNVKKQFERFGGNKLDYVTPAQQVYFIYLKLELIGVFPKDDKGLGKLNQQYNAVLQNTNKKYKETHYKSENKKDARKRNWFLIVIGIILFIFSIAVLNDRKAVDSEMFIGVAILCTATVMLYINIFRRR